LRDYFPFNEEICASPGLDEFFTANQEPASYLKGVLEAALELKDID